MARVRRSCQEETESLQQKHAERVRSMEEQMRRKDRFLAEHRQFVKVCSVHDAVFTSHDKYNIVV